jgi:hypothetical protein
MVSCSQAGAFLLGLLCSTMGLIALLEQPAEVAIPFVVGGLILAWSGRKSVTSG